MFRGCFFEYAGVSSQPYNLVLCYISNNNKEFDAGGGFELKTDTIPYSHETLLYGKDYSQKPLSFEVEIINPDSHIPLEQLVEIKNWLFGQDGWKTLTLRDERQNYCLKCIFEPEEDVADSSGYRGFRCTLQNVSPFWYGEEREIVFSRSTLTSGWSYFTGASGTFASGTLAWGDFEINIPDDDSVDTIIYPEIIIKVDQNNTEYAHNLTKFILANTSATARSTSTGGALSKTRIGGDSGYDVWDCADTSKLMLSLAYITNDVDTIKFNSKYAVATSTNYPNQILAPVIESSAPVPIFKLNRGSNFCRIYIPHGIESLTFKYTPVYRLGAF